MLETLKTSCPWQAGSQTLLHRTVSRPPHNRGANCFING